MEEISVFHKDFFTLRREVKIIFSSTFSSISDKEENLERWTECYSWSNFYVLPQYSKKKPKHTRLLRLSINYCIQQQRSFTEALRKKRKQSLRKMLTHNALKNKHKKLALHSKLPQIKKAQLENKLWQKKILSIFLRYCNEQLPRRNTLKIFNVMQYHIKMASMASSLFRSRV